MENLIWYSVLCVRTCIQGSDYVNYYDYILVFFMDMLGSGLKGCWEILKRIYFFTLHRVNVLNFLRWIVFGICWKFIIDNENFLISNPNNLNNNSIPSLLRNILSDMMISFSKLNKLEFMVWFDLKQVY